MQHTHKGFSITESTTRMVSRSDEQQDYITLSQSIRFSINTGRGTIELSTLPATKALINKFGRSWKAAAKAEARLRFRRSTDLIYR